MRTRSTKLFSLVLVTICGFGCVDPALPPRVEKVTVSPNSLEVAHDFLVQGHLRLMVDEFQSQSPSFKHYFLFTTGGHVRVNSLNDLAGFLDIRNEKEALQYVRLFYSPSNWFSGPLHGLEVATPDIVEAQLLPRVRKIFESETEHNGPFQGAVPASWLARHHLANPMVRRRGETFEIVRTILRISGNHCAVHTIHEIVTKDGHYQLQLGNPLDLKPPHGEWMTPVAL